MLRTFVNKEIKLQTIVKEKELYFKGKDICDALGYSNSKKAIIDHVSDKYKVSYGSLRVTTRYPLSSQTNFVSEPGLYELIFSSKLPAAKAFREWVLEVVLPTLRKTGTYSIHSEEKNSISQRKMIKIESESDLHYKVVDYIRRFYPWLTFIAGLGELQDTPAKRINSWKKGYQKGQVDLTITSCHKKYNGLCIEFKTPKGDGVVSQAQKELLYRYECNNYKILISNDYDLIIRELEDYIRGVRVTCPKCKRKFLSPETLSRHLRCVR